MTSLHQHDREGRNWKMFGYVWKELYEGVRNVRVKKKMGGWQTCVNTLTNTSTFQKEKMQWVNKLIAPLTTSLIITQQSFFF